MECTPTALHLVFFLIARGGCSYSRARAEPAFATFRSRTRTAPLLFFAWGLEACSCFLSFLVLYTPGAGRVLSAPRWGEDRLPRTAPVHAQPDLPAVCTAGVHRAQV
jgi:hypothetical protein